MNLAVSAVNGYIICFTENLKKLASAELGISLSEMKSIVWPLRSAIRNPSDDTVLRSLQLPNYNTVIVQPPSELPIV